MNKILPLFLLAFLSAIGSAKSDDLPEDTKVRAVTIFPWDKMTLSAGVGTLKECRDSVNEMVEQLKQEADPKGDGMIYACVPVELPEDKSVSVEVTRYKQNMFK